MKRVGVLKILPEIETCFINVPSAWFSTTSQCWEIVSEHSDKFYVHQSPQPSTSEVHVEFGSQLASSLGLSQDEFISCKLYSGAVKTASELTIVTEADDYELVASSASFIEEDLLSRMRIVPKRFPVWTRERVVIAEASGIGDIPVEVVNSTRLVVVSKCGLPVPRPFEGRTALLIRAHEADWTLQVGVLIGLDLPNKAVIHKASGWKFGTEPEEPMTFDLIPGDANFYQVKFPHLLLPQSVMRAMKVKSGEVVDLEMIETSSEVCEIPQMKHINSNALDCDFRLHIFDEIADVILRWLNCSPGDYPPNVTVLIHGARKSGKTKIAKQLISKFAGKPFYVQSAVLDYSDFMDRRLETIDEAVLKAIHSVIWQRPALIVLENIADSSEDPHQEHVLLILRALCSLKGVLVLATGTVDALKLHAFHKSFKLPVRLSHDERRAFLKHHSIRCEESLEKCVQLSDGCGIGELEKCVRNAKLSVVCEPEKDFVECFEDATEQVISSKAEKVKKDDVAGLSAVCGLKEVKVVLEECFLWPSRYPKLFARCGMKMRRGVLLYGLPGSGKTFLAHAIAAEANIGLIRVKGPELLSKYIGQSESNIRDVFEKAKSASPCVLFFDEFDSLAPRRGHDSTGVSDRVVNQLLTALDGFEPLDSGIHVLAASSRPDLLDPALVRPGRFDKCLLCPFPDSEARFELLAKLGKKVGLEGDENLTEIVSQETEGFSGADLSALVHNAHLRAIREAVPISWKLVKEELKTTRPSLSNKVRKEYEAAFLRFGNPAGVSNLKGELKVSLA